MDQIRKAKSDDFREVFFLLKQLFAKNKLSLKKTRELLLKRLKTKNSIQLVLQDEKKIIGFASVTFKEEKQIPCFFQRVIS